MQQSHDLTIVLLRKKQTFMLIRGMFCVGRCSLQVEGRNPEYVICILGSPATPLSTVDDSTSHDNIC